MSKSDAFETDLLELVFNAVGIPNIADNTVTDPAATLTIALHTADPGETGDQSTSEAGYTSYVRQTVPRTAGGWNVGTGTVSPIADIDFPQATGGTETITHFSIGTGVGNAMLYSGTVTPSIAVTTGVTPRLTNASTVTED